MKSFKQFLLTVILLPTISFSNPNFAIQTGMHMDKEGHLIQPDKFHLSQAIKAYRDGYNQLAFTSFKKSAALGNSMAQRLIGLMYVNGMSVTKDFIKGYAWLKLAAKDNQTRSIELKNQVFNLLTPEQQKTANKEYSIIFEEYGPIASLTRRGRWVQKQKMKMLGSRTGSLAFAPIAYDSPRGNGFYNSVQSYVNNYNYGIVTTGEIKPID